MQRSSCRWRGSSEPNSLRRCIYLIIDAMVCVSERHSFLVLAETRTCFFWCDADVDRNAAVEYLVDAHNPAWVAMFAAGLLAPIAASFTKDRLPVFNFDENSKAAEGKQG